MEQISYEKEKIIKELQKLANTINCPLADYTILINKDIEELSQELQYLELKLKELNQDLEDDLEDDFEL